MLTAGAFAASLFSRSALAKKGAEPALLLAQKAPDDLDVSRYLVSEKFDGVRAYWDGQHMWTRQGQPIAVPADIAAQLPAKALDGELWMGRGRFEETSAAVRRAEPRAAEWAQLHYMVFELPAAPGSFEQRYAALRELLASPIWPGLRVVEQVRVGDRHQLDARLADTVRGGGEGLVLHEASAPYLSGRSPALLKLKPQDDDEAVVIAHEPGEGRFHGLMGALLVRNAAGRTFRIGTGFSEAQRRSPPPVGATITYRYRGLTSSGLPRFASFLRQSES
ncbi:DNA ligase [Paucibacter sp. R3-3]|uniref:DNA ligase n=1 Tax=Roseateles agri TaxID=3098619 RepID=A0ABU5DGS3_9BURK|nr:DNA ligase [Paucibacter sp. R3-3]MDY0745489.1 DNA ligase [Paucibacter sp. R3-3]